MIEMIEINNILDIEKHLDGIDAVIFDLDDTLYSEKDYVRSGFLAAAPNHFNELWQAFLEGKPAFDTVMPNQKEQVLAAYRNHKPNISMYPGVYEMLARIRESGRKLGLITDGRPKGQRAKIKALGIESLFDKIIITDELGGVEFRKPNDTAFRLMQEKLGVPFDQMVYVGDNVQKDFQAPQQLGMKSCFFHNIEGLYFNKAEKIF